MKIASLRFLVVACAITSLPAATSLAATLDPVSPPIQTTLFDTEVKRDQNVNNSSQRGHDVFVRDGGGSPVSSAPFAWGASGTTYDWSISYDGDTATIDFDGTSRSVDVDPDGVWNAIKLITRSQDDNRFSDAKVTVVVEDANGSPLDAPQSYTAELVEFNEVTLALSDGSDFTSLAGTLTWDFTASGTGSPNSRYAFIVKGLNAIPEPTTAGLALLSTLALAARRKR